MTNPATVTISSLEDSFKYKRTITTLVGLIAFASPDKSFITPKSITINYTHLLYFLYREQSCCRDKVYGAVVRRAVVMVFASPSANFYTGSNPFPLSGDSHLDHFIMTANSSPLIGTMQKHMPTRTRSATKSTSGPLYLSNTVRGQTVRPDLPKYNRQSLDRLTNNTF